MKLSFRSLIDLLYPRLCVACEKCLTGGEEFLCSACLFDLPLAHQAYNHDIRTLRQINNTPCFGKFYALFYYDKNSPYKNLVYALKYRSGKKLALHLGRMLGEKIKGTATVQAVIPVPLHPARRKKRGYNQSELIARGIAEVLQVDMLGNVISRVRDNASQTGKNTEERRRNVENIFHLDDPSAIKDKHLLIVDDVITTGATVTSCLHTLADAPNVTLSVACLGHTLS